MSHASTNIVLFELTLRLVGRDQAVQFLPNLTRHFCNYMVLVVLLFSCDHNLYLMDERSEECSFHPSVLQS